jgi:predicted secreted hydrolase
VSVRGALVAALCAGAVNAASAEPYATVTRGIELQFPRDHGSHPEFRTEWWYVTGWLDAGAERLGFQVTFFRTRPFVDSPSASAFAPRQILIAHAALSDPKRGKLHKAERIVRAGFGLAEAEEGDAAVWIDDWRLERGEDAWTARIAAEDFALDLRFVPTQPPLLQGDRGYSQKGPSAQSASYYYSVPQLEVSGTITREGQGRRVAGRAWLDHEWSSEYLDAGAVGWDWVGLNLADGSALMAFRIRDRAGGARWAGGTLRTAAGPLRTFAPDEVAFIPGRTWRSPRTATTYPVEWRVRVGALELDLEPLFDDQESDTRMTTGAVYWEGAVSVRRDGTEIGRGNLELTGYDAPLVLR